MKYHNIFDVIIVGGGIVGCGLLRDLALHGLKCLLIDKGDFSSQTSQNSSKMLHGGIRYLEGLHFDLLQEALREKNLWCKLAPHLARERPFLLPIYKNSRHSKVKISLGLAIYDLLSGLQNTPHKILDRKRTLEKIPILNNIGLRGSGVYYDAVFDDCKLTLECLYDALEDNCYALNYTELTQLNFSQGSCKIETKDVLNGDSKEFWSKEVVFATGPFTDSVLTRLNCFPWRPVLAPSKGAHIFYSKNHLPLHFPVVIQGQDERVMFVIPQRSGILVGTTETRPNADFFNIEPSSEDIDYLLAGLQSYFPNVKISKDHILSSFAAIRPLVREEGKSLGQISREHKIFYPKENVHVIVGGKYTTFRKMVQELAAKLVTRNGITYNPLKTIKPFRKKSIFIPRIQEKFTEDQLFQIIAEEKPRTFEDIIRRRLGLFSKMHWTQEKSFEDFFLPLIPTLKNYIPISKEIVLSYR